MLKLITKYPRAFVLALTFHVFAAGVFVVNFQFGQKPAEAKKTVDVVQATMVDESEVQAELDKLKAIEAKKRKSETDRVKKLERDADKARKKRLKEQKRLKELEKKRKKELAKKKKLEKERKTADKKRKIAEKKQKKAEKAAKVAEQNRIKEVEQQRLAEDNRRKAEEARERAEEIERKAKEKALAAIEAQQRIDDNRERQRQIDEENKRLQSAKSKQETRVVNRYIGFIKKQVENNWRKPATSKSTMSCDVFVRMMPTGDVLQVEARKCTGDDIFKRSVEDAVRAAAPLPLPPNKSLFTQFREIIFEFNRT